MLCRPPHSGRLGQSPYRAAGADPVIAFVANGVTYMSSEREVGTAFESVKRSGALAEASREFKGR